MSTPAERAALRRQRILAGGADRMSLVTGQMKTAEFASKQHEHALPQSDQPSPSSNQAQQSDTDVNTFDHEAKQSNEDVQTKQWNHPDQPIPSNINTLSPNSTTTTPTPPRFEEVEVSESDSDDYVDLATLSHRNISSRQPQSHQPNQPSVRAREVQEAKQDDSFEEANENVQKKAPKRGANPQPMTMEQILMQMMQSGAMGGGMNGMPGMAGFSGPPGPNSAQPFMSMPTQQQTMEAIQLRQRHAEEVQKAKKISTLAYVFFLISFLASMHFPSPTNTLHLTFLFSPLTTIIAIAVLVNLLKSFTFLALKPKSLPQSAQQPDLMAAFQLLAGAHMQKFSKLKPLLTFIPTFLSFMQSVFMTSCTLLTLSLLLALASSLLGVNSSDPGAAL